jgi:hypothetical protein
MADKNSPEETTLPLIIKPDLFTYFLGGALSFIFWLPTIVTIVLGRWDWKPFALSFGITSLMFFLIHGCRIKISKDGLTYTRLFFWSHFLSFDQMKELKIETGVNRNKPTSRLVITSYSQTHDSLTINIKLFSRKALSTLLKVLSSKAPTARFDKHCKQIKERFMPSLLGDEKEMRSRSKILNFFLKER